MTDHAFERSIRQMQLGDREGLRAVYVEYNAMIYSTVYEILQNHSDAEDAASDFFIKLWNISGLYESGRHHRAWLLTIARNMAYDLLRRHKREILKEISDLPENSCVPSHEDSTVEELGIYQALQELDQDEREIVNLKIMGQLTFKEIAGMLKRPMGTVTWKYRTALGKLKRCGYE